MTGADAIPWWGWVVLWAALVLGAAVVLALLALALVRRALAVVRAAGTSFHRGMRILPPDRRAAMYAIYAFCRQVDDVAAGAGVPGRGEVVRRLRVFLGGDPQLGGLSFQLQHLLLGLLQAPCFLLAPLSQAQPFGGAGRRGPGQILRRAQVRGQHRHPRRSWAVHRRS